jgi:hypothetical protein
VESEFGDDMLDDIIEDAKLPNDGAYTVGNYDYYSMFKFLVILRLSLLKIIARLGIATK